MTKRGADAAQAPTAGSASDANEPSANEPSARANEPSARANERDEPDAAEGSAAAAGAAENQTPTSGEDATSATAADDAGTSATEQGAASTATPASDDAAAADPQSANQNGTPQANALRASAPFTGPLAGAAMGGGAPSVQHAHHAQAAGQATPVERPHGHAAPRDATGAHAVAGAGEGAQPAGHATGSGNAGAEGDQMGQDARQRATAGVPLAAGNAESEAHQSGAPASDATAQPSTGAGSSAQPSVGDPLAALAERLANAVSSVDERPAADDATRVMTLASQDAGQREGAVTPLPSLGVAAPRGADMVTLSGQSALPSPQSNGEEAESAAPKLVARGLAALASQKGGSMQMRLDPPSLGDLRIQMTVVNGAVSAELRPSSAQAHALLAADLASLRQALEAQGLSVERLSVQAPTHQGQGGSAQTGHGLTRGEHTSAGQAAAQQAQPGQQSSSNGQQESGSDRQQRSGGNHDAGHGQSRGRSDSGQRDERDPGSRSRRRASFASVFALRDMT